MKTGKIPEAAFKTDLLDADLVLYQKLADVPHFDLVNKLRIRFPGARLKIPAKRMRTDIGYCCNFFGSYVTPEIGQSKFVDRIDAVVFRLLIIVVKTDRSQRG